MTDLNTKTSPTQIHGAFTPFTRARIDTLIANSNGHAGQPAHCEIAETPQPKPAVTREDMAKARAIINEKTPLKKLQDIGEKIEIVSATGFLAWGGWLAHQQWPHIGWTAIIMIAMSLLSYVLTYFKVGIKLVDGFVNKLIRRKIESVRR